jgi:hypothetical protein
MYWTTKNEEGVIYEDDSEGDEDNVWVDHFVPTEEGRSSETKANNVGDEECLIFDELNSYDYIYSNLPVDVNVLMLVVDYEKCGAKRFQYEMKDCCCPNG